MKTRLAIASIGTVSTLVALGFGMTASASAPSQSAEDAAEVAWETHVASSTPSALPGTLSCAISDEAETLVAVCFALVAGADGAAPSVLVARSTSVDGAVWSGFESVPVAASAIAPAVANPAEGGFAMPDAVGMDLQSAQDLLQETAGNFLYYSSSEDATGEGRMQLMDSNWLVCSQNVAPGATVTDDLNVIFYVVKEDETCP